LTLEESSLNPNKEECGNHQKKSRYDEDVISNENLRERLVKSLEDSGYRSATEYIIFLIRKVLPDLESKDMKRRLKALGYL